MSRRAVLQPHRKSNSTTRRSRSTTTTNHDDDSSRNATQHQIKSDRQTKKRQQNGEQQHSHDQKTTNADKPFANFRGLKNTTCIKRQARNNKHDRLDIVDVFAEFYEEPHTSSMKTHEHEHEDKYEQHPDTMTPCTTHTLLEDSQNTNYDCTTNPSNPTSNHHQTGETRRSKFSTRAGTWHHHRTTSPCVRCPFCTNSPASQTPTSSLTKQASDWATPQQTTFSRSSNSDRWPQSGSSHFGSYPSISKRHPAQLNTAARGRPHVNKAWRSHTYRCSQSCATNNEQQDTPTSQAIPPQVENQTGVPAQHVPVQPTPTKHHEPTS